MRVRLSVIATLIAALVLTALGSALYSFREPLFRYAINPRQPYLVYTPPPVPDYRDAASWAAMPGAQGGATVRPEGDGAGAPRAQPADVFFVHGTTWWSDEGWNAPLSDPQLDSRLDAELVLFASPFAGLGAVWAPRYRQATLFATIDIDEDSRRAVRTAYGDVRAAFAEFLAARELDRPFVLAGRGQGGLHALRLLRDEIARGPLREALIAAYLIDTAVPAEMFRRELEGLRPCTAPDTAGCVLAWVQRPKAVRLADWRRRLLAWAPDGGLRPMQGREIVCVNPLTGTANGRAPLPRNNPGAVERDPGPPAGLGPLEPFFAGADCWDGLLVVTQPQREGLFDSHAPWRDLMPPERNLFYASLRADAARRAAAWQAQP